MAAVLEVEGVTGGYGRIPVLHGVSLQLDAGERIGLFGPNGHGKTTLLRTISGLLRPWQGDIRFEGQSIASRRPNRIVDLGIVHVMQGSTMFRDMSVAENLRLGAYSARARPDAAANLERVLQIFPRLRERSAQHARTLSGGERQMLAIGVGLMAAPRLLMLDEPTLGLAPRLKDELAEAVGAIAATGIPLLLVEQDVQFLLDLTSRLLMIEHGAVIAEFTAEAALDQAHIAEMYFGKRAN
ncbi:MAG: ABC transporter ATP-binding protein [Alphaproteobacteria bacterium]